MEVIVIIITECQLHTYIRTCTINPSQGRGQPLGSFLSTSFDQQYALSFIYRRYVSSSLLLSLSTAASVALCRQNCFHGVFVFSSHHMTVPSQSGLSYFVNNACHPQRLSDKLTPFLVLQ